MPQNIIVLLIMGLNRIKLRDTNNVSGFLHDRMVGSTAVEYSFADFFVFKYFFLMPSVTSLVAVEELQKEVISVVNVQPSIQNNSFPTGRIFMKF
jgi:hypothetical protein